MPPRDSQISVSTGATGRIVTVGPAQRHGAAAGLETAPGWGGDPGPASKFRGGQGQAPAAPGTRARDQAVPPALTSRSPRHLCRCLLVPGCTGHLQPRSVFWEGVRMRTGDVQAQELRQPHTSRSRLGSLPVSAASAARGHGPGVRRVPVWWLPGPAVSSGAGASPMLRLPEPRGRRCWRCANTPGTGPEAAAAKTDSPEICWHGRSATEPGPTPVLLEPGPCPGPVLMATRAGRVRGGSTTPPKHRVEPKLCLSPFPIADPDQHHDNHNRVQLWGSQTCPRVSGLRSHSQSCSILGPCSTMGTAECREPLGTSPGAHPVVPGCG